MLVRRFFLLLLLFSTVAVFSAEVPIEVLTSVAPASEPQYGNLLHERICKAVLNAKRSVRIFNYSSNDDQVILALNQAASRGVSVGCVFDKAHLPPPGALHPDIRVFTRTSGDGHYHHKIYLIDEKKIYIGTANIGGLSSWPNIMVYARSRKLAVPILEEWDFYSDKKKREHFHAHDTILGQPIELFMFPHVPSKSKDGEEKEANEKALKMYLDSIEHAKRKIVVSMVVWTMKDIAKALVKARLERRVDVSCYGANIDPMVRQILALGGIALYNRPVTHHKTMLIDDAVLVNGAANFSISAFSRSDESATKMEECNPQQVSAIYQAIQALPI